MKKYTEIEKEISKKVLDVIFKKWWNTASIEKACGIPPSTLGRLLLSKKAIPTAHLFSLLCFFATYRIKIADWVTIQEAEDPKTFWVVEHERTEILSNEIYLKVQVLERRALISELAELIDFLSILKRTFLYTQKC